MCARGLQDTHRSKYVDLGVVVRPLDRGADVGLGCQVNAELRLHQIEDPRGVPADVSKVQLGPGGELLATPRRERVEHVHLVAAGNQRLRDMRADEARSACHDRPQGLVS